MSRIVPITPEMLDEAARLLRRGALVAFPTETVYGLGADATDDRAVARIFEAKDRPRFNPLIVHLTEAGAAKELARFDGRAAALAERFWPGPLTLVLRRSADCPLSPLVSAGLDTVALRVPAHDGARSLLRMAGVPVAAPSANRAGQLSPTRATHVQEALANRVALILDGGPCPVGVESTVVDLSSTRPTLLRPGGLPLEDIEAALDEPVALAGTTPDAPKSPGMVGSHYAPSIPLRMEAREARPGEALLGFGPDAAGATLNLSPSGDLVEAAANLFHHLHILDQGDYSGIAVMAIPERGLGRAINDRLRRAAAA